MNSLTIRIPDDIAAGLDAAAASLDRSKSYLAAKAIKEFVDRETWIRAEITAGLEEARRGEFASDAKVKATFDKFKLNPKSAK